MACIINSLPEESGMECPKPPPAPEVIIVKRIFGFHLFVCVNNIEGGTHENYDILFNSDCNREFFGTFIEAATKANEILKKYDGTTVQPVAGF